VQTVGGSRMKFQVCSAVAISSSMVALARVLGTAPHSNVFSRLAFLAFLPGLLVGSSVPGNGFGWEGDLHRWGLPSLIVTYLVNVSLYALLSYGVIVLVAKLRRRPRAVRNPNP
jgi:hypothetical protein